MDQHFSKIEGNFESPKKQQLELQRCLRQFIFLASSGNLSIIYRNRPVWANNDVQFLTENAIVVFDEFPCSKHAVLNYLGLLIHEGTHLNMSKIENPYFATDYTAIEEAVHLLSKHVRKCIDLGENNEWIVDILKWCSILLAEISDQNAGRISINSQNVVDIMQFYLGFSCIRSVIFELLNSSIEKLLNVNPKNCVRILLESGKFNTNFDWALVHIGNSFPESIPVHLLAFGFEQFRRYVHDLNSHQKLPINIEQIHGENGIRFRALSAVYSHFAMQKNPIFKSELANLIMESLKNMQETGSDDFGVAFVFKLMTFSADILRILLPELCDLVTFEMIVKGAKMIKSVPNQAILVDGQYGIFMMQMINALDRSDVAVLMDMLIPMAYDDSAFKAFSSSDVRLCSQIVNQMRLILEEILSDILRTVHSNLAIDFEAFPILKKYFNHMKSQKMLQNVLNGDLLGRQFHLRLLTASSIACGELKSAQLLSQILFNAKNENQLATFVALGSSLVPFFPRLFDTFMANFESFLVNSHTNDDINLWTRNLLTLISLEKQDSVKKLGFCDSLMDNFHVIMPILLSMADKSDSTSVCNIVYCILECLNTPVDLAPRSSYKITRQLAALFFCSLRKCDTEEGKPVLYQGINCSINFVESQPFCKELFLTSILETAFNDLKICKNDTKIENASEGLLDQIQKLVPSGKVSDMVHSGIIGKKRKKLPILEIDECKESNILRILRLVEKCCQKKDGLSSNDVIVYDLPTLKHVADLLVQNICPDSISAHFCWEDWHLERESISRYILVSKRIEKEHTLCWGLLNLLSDAYPSLWFSTPLIKALLASIVIQFESSVDKNARPSKTTLCILDRWFLLTNKGLMLPSTLASVYDIIPHVSVHEAFILLLDVWRYLQNTMLEFPTLITDIEPGRKVEPIQSHVKPYMDNCRLVLQRNIAQLGDFYLKLFRKNENPS